MTSPHNEPAISFNPLPRPKQGEMVQRNPTAADQSESLKFQSAPPAEARGDAPEMERWEVSIRSPGRSKGRSVVHFDSNRA